MKKRLCYVSIKGARWKVRLLTHRTFKKHHGDASAVTEAVNRYIHFSQPDFTLPIVRHEVRHAFVSELCLNGDEVEDLAEFEEIQCCLDERHWDDMNAVSQAIFKALS